MNICAYLSQLAKDRVDWWAFVNTELSLRVALIGFAKHSTEPSGSIDWH
jgi:hypothetical protein